MPRPARLLRMEDPSFFKDPTIFAVHDQVKNIVHFNRLFREDKRLETMAIAMDLRTPVLHLPADYLTQ